MFEIGNSLREARVRQHLDFPEIEQATKIRSKYLRALEDEQFDVLPAQTYVKGFLRSYAEYLGLDGQLYVDEYNSRYVTGEEEPEVTRPRGNDLVRRRRPVESRGIVVALAGIGALTALVIAAWKAAPSGDQTVPNLPSATSPRPSPQPAQRRLVAVVTAKPGNTWLQIREGTARGRELYRGTLEAGQARSFTRPQLWIFSRAPGNLRLTVNGRARPLPGRGAPRAFVVTPGRVRTVALGT